MIGWPVASVTVIPEIRFQGPSPATIAPDDAEVTDAVKYRDSFRTKPVAGSWIGWNEVEPARLETVCEAANRRWGRDATVNRIPPATMSFVSGATSGILVFLRFLGGGRLRSRAR